MGIILFDAVVDLIVLVILFCALREYLWLNFRDFPKYFLAVVVGGLVIDLAVFVVRDEKIAFCVIVAMLAIYNMFLCRTFFGMMLIKAACIGLVMSFATHPFLWMALLEPSPI